MTLTRVHIAEHVTAAFDPPPASKSDLLTTAAAAQAPEEILQALDSLPERPYHGLRELWAHLPEVPVDA
jgi:hypothetical protein